MVYDRRSAHGKVLELGTLAISKLKETKWITALLAQGPISFLSQSNLFVSRGVLPDQQLNNDAKDIVKLATGLIATLSALVVSLLGSYAKGTFNQVNGFNIPDLAQGVLTALPQTVKHRKRRCVIEIGQTLSAVTASRHRK